ncbi:MAG: DNA mismatch repair protein MutS, partial [Lachnospiraceae bacterium]|nr:DNA mismatch repair protein MutS [Lachnospiraceae bacterium]
MMQKYLETKKEYPDCILFYRLGDFYEMFFEDAEEASRILGLTLTGKDCGLEERAPMCGVPYHAVDTYLTKLVESGRKVAIAEQMEDPKLAKGLVKREVIRVVTPGTILDANALDETQNHYIMCLVYERTVFGLAVCDVTTGEFLVSEAETRDQVYDEINRFAPSEIILNEAFSLSGADLSFLREKLNFALSVSDSFRFKEEEAVRVLLKHFEAASTEALGIQVFPVGTIASGALLSYLLDTQKTELKHISRISLFTRNDYMLVDSATRRNLELT